MRLILCCVAILAGCAAGPEARPVVAVSCIRGEPPAVPQTATEGEIIAMSEYAATLTVWTERLMLKAYAAKAEAVIQACR